MARALTDSRDFFGALSRAYALGGEHPPHHPAVRVALAEAMTTLHDGSDATADVAAEALHVQGQPGGPLPTGLGAALARAGVARISVAEQTPTEALESLLRRLRPESGRPIEASELSELEAQGLRLSLTDPSPSAVAGSVESTAAPTDVSPVTDTGSAELEPLDTAVGESRSPPVEQRLARSISALFVQSPTPTTNGQAKTSNGVNGTAAAAPEGPADFGADLDAFIDQPNSSLADRLADASETMTSSEESLALVDAVRRLVAASSLDGKDPRLVLARRIARSDVQTQMISMLAKSPDASSELTRIIVGLGAVASEALARAIAEAQDGSVRRALMETMVALGAVGREPVQRMLNDDRWFVARNGVRLLPDVAGKGAVGDLLGITTHPEPRVRREVITALARTGTMEAAAALLAMVDDADPLVRGAAAASLGVIEVADRGAALLRRLQLEVDADVQIVLIRALAATGYEAAVPELERRAARGLFSRRPKNMRLEAIHALWAIGTPRARAVVMAALDDRDPEIKGAVRTLLGGH